MGDAGTDDVRFVRVEASGNVDVPFALEVNGSSAAERAGYRIVPQSPLEPGARYALWTRDCDGVIAAEAPPEPDGASAGTSMMRSRFALFDVAPEAPLPGELGAIVLSASRHETLQLQDLRGACAARYSATTRDATLDVRSPWADAIAFTTWVDGQRYAPSDALIYAPPYGGSWVGRGRDKLVAICATEDTPPLISSGAHKLQFRGSIPGTSVTLSSEEASFELQASCDATDAGDSDPSTKPPATVADAGTSPSAEASHDATDGGDSDASTKPPTRAADAGTSPRAQASGDGCSVSRQPPSNVTGWCLAALSALLLLRKRGGRRGLRRAADAP
jgi:hypothetical protein